MVQGAGEEGVNYKVKILLVAKRSQNFPGAHFESHVFEEIGLKAVKQDREASTGSGVKG